jgi:hypothetical protein
MSVLEQNFVLRKGYDLFYVVAMFHGPPPTPSVRRQQSRPEIASMRLSQQHRCSWFVSLCYDLITRVWAVARHVL